MAPFPRRPQEHWARQSPLLSRRQLRILSLGVASTSPSVTRSVPARSGDCVDDLLAQARERGEILASLPLELLDERTIFVHTPLALVELAGLQDLGVVEPGEQ